MPKYKNITCYCCQKIGHTARHYTEPAPIAKDNGKSDKAFEVVQIEAIILCSVKNCKNLDLLHFDTTDNTYNSRDIFINFCPIR